MAYLSQYEIDMNQDAKMNNIYKGLGNAVTSGMEWKEENRRRALDESRKATLAQQTQAEHEYQKNQRALPIEQQDAFKKESALLRLKQESELLDLDKKEKIKAKYRNNGQTKMDDKEKIDYRHKLQEESKQPAQNEYAAAGYAKRARQAEEDLAKLPSDIGSGGLTGLLDYVPNAFVPEEHQLFDQAKRNFISANLRKESGAAISDAEYANEEKKYFTQPGDSKAVIEQKARARAQALANLEAEGARALRKDQVAQTPQAPQQAPQVHPQIQQKIQSYTPEQKAARLQQLKAKQSQAAMR